MKKNLLVIIIGLVLTFASYRLLNDGKLIKAEVENKPVIAACPTYHHYLSKLSEEGFEVLKSSSTGKAVADLEKGRVEFVISGRRLKPSESNFKSLKIGDGYSLLSSQELVIKEDEMAEFKFFTDLNPEKIVEDFPQLKDNLEEVENPYSKLQEGIIITSFKNTDYLQGEIVHALNEQGERVRELRRPTLYFDEKKENEAKKIIDLIQK